MKTRGEIIEELIADANWSLRYNRRKLKNYKRRKNQSEVVDDINYHNRQIKKYIITIEQLQKP